MHEKQSNVSLYYHKRYQTEFWVQFLATGMPDIHAVEADGGPSSFSASSLKKMDARFKQMV